MADQPKVGEVFVVSPDGSISNRAITILNVDKYPHLSRKLEWWEERKPEELPKYVKNAADGIVFKVEYNFNGHTPSDVHTWNAEAPLPFWHSLYHLLPATPSDYLQQTVPGVTGKEV